MCLWWSCDECSFEQRNMEIRYGCRFGVKLPHLALGLWLRGMVPDSTIALGAWLELLQRKRLDSFFVPRKR